MSDSPFYPFYRPVRPSGAVHEVFRTFRPSSRSDRQPSMKSDRPAGHKRDAGRPGTENPCGDRDARPFRTCGGTRTARPRKKKSLGRGTGNTPDPPLPENRFPAQPPSGSRGILRSRNRFPARSDTGTYATDPATASRGGSSGARPLHVSARRGYRYLWEMSVMNSSRVRWSERKIPVKAEVVVADSCFSTPRICMHMWLASITTATPIGLSAS